jgi:hypothetical protein
MCRTEPEIGFAIYEPSRGFTIRGLPKRLVAFQIFIIPLYTLHYICNVGAGLCVCKNVKRTNLFLSKPLGRIGGVEV